jgi:hypothetical protein
VQAKLQKEPPETVTSMIHSPWPLPKAVELIHSMSWFLSPSRNTAFFVTGDNPVFFVRGYGLANVRTELCIPINPYWVLSCNWQARPQSLLVTKPLKQSLMNEINKRTISNSTRFVFSHRTAPWIAQVAGKPAQRLTHIEGLARHR